MFCWQLNRLLHLITLEKRMHNSTVFGSHNNNSKRKNFYNQPTGCCKIGARTWFKNHWEAHQCGSVKTKKLPIYVCVNKHNITNKAWFTEIGFFYIKSSFAITKISFVKKQIFYIKSSFFTKIYFVKKQLFYIKKAVFLQPLNL